jgi:hypothetical protein
MSAELTGGPRASGGDYIFPTRFKKERITINEIKKNSIIGSPGVCADRM